MNTQTTLYFGLRAGEIWQLWRSIVMVLQVGSSDGYNRFLPNCIEYEYLGEVDPLHGRWWERDPREPVLPQLYGEWALTPGARIRRADRIYFKPWCGRGFFYATAQAEAIWKLQQQWLALRETASREAKQRVRYHQRMKALENRMRAIASKQLAPEGFC